MFKVIDEFRDHQKLEFAMVPYKNVFVIKAKEWIDFLFDIKESYDNSEAGRLYSIKENKDNLIIKFTKEGNFTLYVCIMGFSEYRKVDYWLKKKYDFDKKRNSMPFERYIYESLSVYASTVVLSVSEKEEDSVKECEFVFNNIKNINLISNKEFKLENLLVKTDKGLGLFAGLPWFFQFWSRDELISLKALIMLGKRDEAKEILMRNLNSVAADGRLPNQTLPLSEKTNADSVGWLFKRIQYYKNFNPVEKEIIIKKLEFSIDNIIKNYMKGGLIYNAPLETWMDAEWAYDNRQGFRIEIQALFLNMLNLAFKLTKNKKYKVMEEKMKKLVKEKFFNGVYLTDGMDDWTKRPNVFIAAYVYQGLLTKNEWETCFKALLQDLWLDWGGIATIDKENPIFCKKHTGEIPQSYHRGDSWFWLNNLAAIVLHRINKKMFNNYIKKIIKASKGKHSELSSASQLKSEGCSYQAWTDAMFVELIKEIK